MRSVGKHPKKCLGVYLEVYSVFGYVPKPTEWGPGSRRPQTATVVLDRRQSGPLLSKAQSPNIGLSDYPIIRLSDIRISAKSYIRVGPYYPKLILEQRIIGSIFEHERI